MIPLTMAKLEEEYIIKRVGGKEDIRLFLARLGFVPGAHITVITKIGENVIVNIKESRVAISREMAFKIMV
ncbi:MAG: ferrous iron transport protein A [Oscillospiraceae bacterium]|jgi:ferrous iron transport protein A|nr:ferrous iron transport protein A [Oscillospiraceae bacterium]